MSTFVQTQVETGTTTLPRISSAVKELLSQCKNAAPAHESLTDGSTYRSYEPDIDEVVVLYDLDAIDGCLDSVTSAFVKSYHGVNASKQPLQDPAIVHCFAIKSCPLSGILEYMVDRGYGLETASVGEVQQALASGCKPENVMFDSPCKSTSDIEYALRAGVHMNANSLQEVEKIKGVIESMKRHDVEVKGTVGLRVNPLVGGTSHTQLGRLYKIVLW
jgi:diaminopimelate decarboxylase